MLSTAYYPRYIKSYTVGIWCGYQVYIVWRTMLPTSYIYVVHGIYRLFWPTLYTMSSTPYTHSICRLRHMTVIPTAYIHGICNPRYMAGMPTAYLPHYIRPHHITRRPHYMCSTRHMHMVWVTLTLFPTAYNPRHNLFSTSYTHGICTPDIPWVYAVDTTCICRGEHMPWVHMSSGDVVYI